MQPERKAVLKKYFSGDCSEEEKKIIEQILLNADNASLSEYLKTEWDSISGNVIPDHATAERRYNHILSVIGKPQRSLKVWYWAAAILLVLLTPLFYLKFRGTNNPDIKWLTVSTAAGEQKEVVLPDGSHVLLNYASSVTYPEKFGETNRKITMAGEAFFSVTKNKHKPFIVAFGNHYTQVLGTSFNIKAYPNSAQQFVTVTEGKVAVGEISKDQLHQYTVLHPNESLTLSIKQEAPQKKLLAGTDDIVSWKRKEIQFRETLLPDVVEELQRRYDVNLVVKDKPDIRMPSFTMLIKPETSLEDVLKILTMTNKISYQKIDEKIVITPN